MIDCSPSYQPLHSEATRIEIRQSLVEVATTENRGFFKLQCTPGPVRQAAVRFRRKRLIPPSGARRRRRHTLAGLQIPTTLDNHRSPKLHKAQARALSVMQSGQLLREVPLGCIAGRIQWIQTEGETVVEFRQRLQLSVRD
jgi:hypothetical protein